MAEGTMVNSDRSNRWESNQGRCPCSGGDRVRIQISAM